MRALVSGLVLLMMMWSPAVMAQGLSDYKNQKHGKRERVTRESCPQAYYKRCMSKCEGASCAKTCRAEAPEFCSKRETRKTFKTVETVAKGASLGIGAVAVLIENAIDAQNLKDGRGMPMVIDEYTLIWNQPSLVVRGGGGYIFGNVAQGTATVKARYSYFGVSGQVSYLTDGTQNLVETDVGPTVYMKSSSIVFGAQPSLLVSQGNGVAALYGVGLRTYTDVHLGRVVLSLDPMLGYTNDNWNYHVRVGAGYRFTPNITADLTYDFRDVVDLNDLDISQAVLQGVTLQLGVRFN